MPLGHPLIEDSPGEIPTPFIGVTGSAQVSGLEATAAGQVGPTGASEHDTHLWVGVVMFVALVLIVGLHVTGFRFATDVGVTRG